VSKEYSQYSQGKDNLEHFIGECRKKIGLNVWEKCEGKDKMMTLIRRKRKY